MKIRKKISVLLLCLMLVTAGCSGKGEAKAKQPSSDTENIAEAEDQTSEVKEKEPKDQARLDMISPAAYNNADGVTLEKGAYISVIGKSAGGQFWNEVKRGAERAAADINENLGYKGDDKVKLTYNGPSEAESVDEQVNILDEELARYPTALAISITDTQACEVQFDLAAENDIPVVAFDSGSEYKGLMAMASTDNQKAAREAAQHMSEELGGRGEVVLIAHDSKSETAIVRETAFAEAVQNDYPEISVSGIYRLDEMQKIIADDVNEGKYLIGAGESSGEPLAEEDRILPEAVTREDILDYILKKHPNVKGICATNGETVMDVIDGLKRQQMENVAVIGYDADEEEIKALKDGEIKGLIVQNPFGMGYASVIAASRAALQMGNEAQIDTGYIWVTKDNLEDASVQEMLY